MDRGPIVLERALSAVSNLFSKQLLCCVALHGRDNTGACHVSSYIDICVCMCVCEICTYVCAALVCAEG